MKLIFVRHGEPDYKNDALTEKGRIEAELASRRIRNWKVTQFYQSPLGRAKETASYTLKAMGREAIELPWLKEFYYPTINEVTGHRGVPWDFVASDWTADPNMFEPEDGFLKFPYIAKIPGIKEGYHDVITGFDAILEEYGYKREKRYYLNTKEHLTRTSNQRYARRTSRLTRATLTSRYWSFSAISA